MKPMSQAELSQATSSARRWFEWNRKRFRYHLPERTDRTYEQVYDDALDEVETPLHLYALSQVFEANALAETRDRPTTCSPTHSEAHSRTDSSRGHVRNRNHDSGGGLFGGVPRLPPAKLLPLQISGSVKPDSLPQNISQNL